MTTRFFLLARILRAWTVGGIALGCVPALAATFTNNTAIGVDDTNYDGMPIVITNCTVTIDGQHTFANVLVASGGVLTHSYSPNGVLSEYGYITDEAQVLTSTNPVTLLNSNVLQATVSVTDLTGKIDYTNGVDYLLTEEGGLTELQRTTNSSIPSGATVLVSYEVLLSATPTGLYLTVTSNVEVDAGGAINVNGKGFGEGFGLGFGSTTSGPEANGGGGGFGGTGGLGSSNAVDEIAAGVTYGSYNEPAYAGSSGGDGFGGFGGAGGGLIEIQAGGSLIINGSVTANGAAGTNASSGGGSGGGIWMIALDAAGSGAITANGGGGEPINGGGGGGGRIAIQCATSSLTGPISAYGGPGAHFGGAGTIYTQVTGENGLLLIDNGGQVGTNTPLPSANLTNDVFIQGNAIVTPPGATWTVGNLTIASNGLVLASRGAEVNITSSGAIIIEEGGGLLANAVGSDGSGAGRNEDGVNGGGGYGGYGASGFSTSTTEDLDLTGGEPYGYQESPSGFGSAGGGGNNESVGGAGGGSIGITSLGGIVEVEGTLSANGGNGSYLGGGGSGGTIVLSGGTLLGSGVISVNGGNGAGSASAAGGGGGGGRMLISPTASLFGGTITAYGGGGGNWGGAGTIVMSVPQQTAQLILDNGGNTGTNTLVQSAPSTDLIVRNGAIASASETVSLDDLYLYTNGWIRPSFNGIGDPGEAVSFSFAGNATIQAGGGIVADLAGELGVEGNAPGSSSEVGSTNLGGGGGHGGRGGSSFGNYAAGGATYDSSTSPTESGSGGGTQSGGGVGGGIIKLAVSGTLELDGIISANGGAGSGLGGGGGAGGSIWLAVGTFSGGGSVSANGGSGADGLGGGGGGGIIYIPCDINSFAGTLTAYGGGGANWGGAGPAVIQVENQHGQLVLDDDGHAGPATPLPSSTTTDVTLRNGAVGLVNESIGLGNLVIETNAVLLVTNTATQDVLTCSSVTIQPGGGIIADFAGYAAGEGSGSGRTPGNDTNGCSGAGHGGYGANSARNAAPGGGTYDSPANPSELGSGGGTDSPYSIGGAGGGELRLTVTGLLQNNGVISANGANGTGFGGGGGSGGAIWLTAGILSGSGVIAANGGSGAGSLGGGGAGGCIAIYPTSNEFSGVISAYGGGGANWGGAGTVYIDTTPSQYILNNGGESGAPTPIPSSTTSLVLSGGVIGLVTSSLQQGSLLVNSNAVLLVSNRSGDVTLTFTSLTIQAGGGIIADSEGETAGEGSGAGRNSDSDSNPYACGGAGHGGNGGNGAGTGAVGGGGYDSQTEPSQVGSGGGSESPNSTGGPGGGAIHIEVSGAIENDGVISANGGAGGGIGGGGGAGGSIWLTADSLSGTGVIAANGGAGANSVGGGGAGGCIVLFPTVNTFSGTVSAYGGGGAMSGGAGTLLIETTEPPGQFILDNDGQSGAMTPIQSANTSALILRNGAAGYPQNSGETFASLLVASNAWLVAVTNIDGTPPGSVNVTLTGNATVEAGGGIVTDGVGSSPGEGNGAGHTYLVDDIYVCGGAGYGGEGGSSVEDLASGGSAYGSVTQPNANGSGGGNSGGANPPGSTGGAGGGSIRLMVDGTLQVDGKISSDGGNASGLGGGGGSGGSIWLTAGTLAGTGSITANGGSGVVDIGGGGGGGRISISYGADDFTGQIGAFGGNGYVNGGAGTIYTVANSQSLGQLLIDNGGAEGTNTPLSVALGAPSQPFNLTVQNGAIVSPQTNLLQLNNLVIGSGGELAGLPGQSNLDLLVFDNLEVASGGVIAVDGQGYSQTNGPGAGPSVDGFGSGAGYGGVGGASAAPGGVSYGSSNQPVSWGSGGGEGSGPAAGGSQGGGAIRLNVGGVLTVDGEISAAGEPGLQDNSGGGSGGSIWVTVGTLTGSGQFAADGGAGDLYAGGGGAGGRIALYANLDAYFGPASASGGGGDFTGDAGTIYSNSVPPLQVLSNSPAGIVSNGVSSLVLYFNAAPNPSSLTAASLSLMTPNGPLSSSLSVAMLGSSTYQVAFQEQTTNGAYSIIFGTNIVDLYGRPLSPQSVATFTISLPVIQGFVTDTNGNPLAGVLLQSTGGLLNSAMTGTNGSYSITFLPGSSFTITPSSGLLLFAPPSMSYANVSSASILNQNYVAVSTIAPTLVSAVSSTNIVLGWQGLAGVTYQIYSSPDLINWQPYGGPIIGSNAAVQILVPVSGVSAQFFNVQASP